MSLNVGFSATGEVRLLGAKLGGSLDCVGAKFQAETDAKGDPGGAFLADGLEAGLGVIMKGVTASGVVRLPGANIGAGGLNCSGATFKAERNAKGELGVALFADGLVSRAGVFLRRGFNATGVVRLLGAKIGTGGLDCSGATFRAEKDAEGNPGIALSADGLETTGSVLLRRATVVGQLMIPGAKIEYPSCAREFFDPKTVSFDERVGGFE